MKLIFINFLFIFFSFHGLLSSQECQNTFVDSMSLENDCISYSKNPTIRIQNKTQENLTLYLFYCTSEVSSTESIDSMLYCSETLTEHFKNVKKPYFSNILTSKDVPLKQPQKTRDFKGSYSSISHNGYETYNLPMGRTTLIPIERPFTQKKSHSSSINYYIGDKVFIIVTRGESAPCLERQSPHSYIGTNHYKGDWPLINIDNHYLSQLPWLLSSPIKSAINGAFNYFGAYSGWLDPEKVYHSDSPVAFTIERYSDLQVEDLDRTNNTVEDNSKTKDYCSLTIHANIAGPEDISTFYTD